MQGSDIERFTKYFEALCATFRVEATEAIGLGYWTALQKLPWSEFEKAITRALGECERMPTPAELRALSGAETGSLKALRAFDAVRQAIHRHGRYASVDFGPEVNAAVRACGGWGRMCSSLSQEFESFLRRDFERAFEAYTQAAPTEDEAQPLAGELPSSVVRVQIAGEAPRRALASVKP